MRLGYRLSQASAIVKSAAVWSCVGAVHGRLESHSVVALLCSGRRTDDGSGAGGTNAELQVGISGHDKSP